MSAQNSAPVSMKFLYVAFVLVVLIWFLNLAVPIGWTSDERGTFGDMFGVANSIFSGLALLGVVYAILLQRHEVSIAREELERTKVILEDQSRALNKQNDDARVKSFEETFFKMLSLHNEMLTQIDLTDGTTNTTGRDVIASLWLRLGNKFKFDYEKFYEANGKELGHYFRMLFNIVKYIDEKAPENPKFYSNLVRAQLSDLEAAMLMVNGLSRHGEKFKPLIEKYHLLKHVKQMQFDQSGVNAKAYSAFAFDKNGSYPEFMEIS